jgi:hypothetical protein
MVRSHRFRSRFALFSLALVGALTVVGCVPGGNSTVTGTVTVGGSPVSGGSVSLYSNSDIFTGSGDGYLGAINVDGTFSIHNVPAGTYQIWLANPQSPLPGQIPAQDLYNQLGLTVTIPYDGATVTDNIALP